MSPLSRSHSAPVWHAHHFDDNDEGVSLCAVVQTRIAVCADTPVKLNVTCGIAQSQRAGKPIVASCADSPLWGRMDHWTMDIASVGIAVRLVGDADDQQNLAYSEILAALIHHITRHMAH